MKGSLLANIVAAMENSELQVYYQPQYNAKKGLIGGAEALVRWIKADGTIVPPGQFIPELEKNKQVSIVDWFVVEEACKTVKALGDKAVKISVNFGREHAKDKNFVKKLDKLIKTYGINKEHIGVEITESDFATDKDEVIQWVTEIKEAGYTVSIDDFGSGMSSMGFVKEIPANVLKIDKSFLDDNCETEKGRITLESVFYFAHRLKLSTVVEGVETEEQLRFINTCDADYIQGFIFSKPVPKNDFLTMCLEEAPVEVHYDNPFENQAGFGQVRALIEAVYKKFPLIIFVNLSKNSYYIMRKENYVDASIPQTGTYDDGYELVMNKSDVEYHKDIEEAFARENLLKAYERGETKVMRIVNQKDCQGNDIRVALEDYFMTNPVNDDVYVVSFMHNVNFDEKIYIGCEKNFK